MDPVWAEAETEILVHAAAPSLVLHDAYYRALASAYLGFQPARTTLLVPGTHGDVSSSSNSATCPSSAEAIIDSPQLSFEGVWGNAGSPTPAPLHPCPDDGETLAADLQSSLSVPPSEVADSQPFHHLRLGIRSSQQHGADSPPRPESPSSTLPSSSPSPSSPPGRGDTDMSAPASLDSRSADFGDFLGDDGDDAAPSSGRADSEPLFARSSPPPARELLLMTKSLSDFGPTSRSEPFTSYEARAARHGRGGGGGGGGGLVGTKLAGALEVFAPEPEGSCDDLDPSSLLTYNLIKLDSDLGLRRRFLSKRRLLRGREPRPTERGFWEVACSGWDPRAKKEAWAYLARYVGEGRAGWGVWLRRDAAATDSIRLYSFGHVVGHMYLLLYTATRRRILSLDCTWTSGGDGLVFVPATKGGWDA